MFTRYLIPVLIMAGLILSPFAVPASANAMSGGTIAVMADDMSCCPSEQPMAPDCQKTCPLMTACAANTLAVTPPFLASHPFFGARGNAIRPSSDAFGAPLADGPPARPPRI